MSKCYYCDEEVDFEREEFLIATKRKVTCKNCSGEKRNIGYMLYAHKTAPEVVMCSLNEKETVRLMRRANRRAR